MKFHKIITISVIYFFIFESYSLAYLDPGTGSSLLQVILALIAGIGSFLGFYWKKTIIFFKDIKQKFNNKNKDTDQEKKS